jgi:kinesin family protein 2/24
MQYIIHYADNRKPMTICILDLAGSERASTATANSDRERQREAIQINAALAALKECIRARLVGQQHVPWRQSKLTMVLRHAFGDVQALQDNDIPEETTSGTSQLVVLACVSPSIADVDDTIGTMNYISPFQVGIHHVNVRNIANCS